MLLEGLLTSLTNQGRFREAIQLAELNLELHEEVLGLSHLQIAADLNILAGLYLKQGMYKRAESLLVRALDIAEVAQGEIGSEVASILGNLGSVYLHQDAYARAELLLIRALHIKEKMLKVPHPNVAVTLRNLSSIYFMRGAYDMAESLLLPALDVNEGELRSADSVVATLVNLARIHELRGDYVQAEGLLIRALNVSEKRLGSMHSTVALVINNLAALGFEQGSYARAESLLIRALYIHEKTLGAMHPKVAAGLNNLALVLQKKGSYASAERLYFRALDIRKNVTGTMHPEVVPLLGNMAELYRLQGQYARMEPYLALVSEIRERHLRVGLARLSSLRKRDLMALLKSETYYLVSLHAHEVPMRSNVIRLAFTAVLRRKGRVLDSLVDAREVLRGHLPPHLQHKLAQLTDASEQLSQYLRAPFDTGAVQQKPEINLLRDRIDALEAELNAVSADYRAQSHPVTIAKVQSVLPDGAALVEIVRYRRYDVRQYRWREEHYLAYMLRKQGPPQWVALGEAARIDAGVGAVLATMRKDASGDAAKAALRHLDALVLTPIRERLTGVSHIILSPDGQLNLVPFEALIDSQGRYAIEQQLISYVTSGRDLLRFTARRAAQSQATVVADPDYGPGQPFGRLPGTRTEALEIERHFPGIKTLTEGLATKAELASIAGPSVLHIATHGFFSRGDTSSFPTVRHRVGVFERGMSVVSTVPALPPPPPDEDPAEALDRAGLALSGANVRPDGIVSAREIAGWNWWGTQLVVLSACETGVGAVPSGEGVYGMRRALVLAGAQAQVVTLWNVNDSSAPELMREFYGELAQGTGRAEALRRAKLRILRQPQFAHPYYWAGFIPAGDWTPLEKGTMPPVKPPAN